MVCFPWLGASMVLHGLGGEPLFFRIMHRKRMFHLVLQVYIRKRPLCVFFSLHSLNLVLACLSLSKVVGNFDHEKTFLIDLEGKIKRSQVACLDHLPIIL